MKCALCLQREADKKNTHFLTDGIIRSCLNLEGASQRERGFYFDLSSDKPFVEFNFQRGTSIIELESSLGRSPSEDEILKAKAIPFSVDCVFCTQCEVLFTGIESDFIREILPQFRNAELQTESLKISDNKLVRLFFYLQVWRTSICDDTVMLSPSVSEELRRIILDHKNLNSKDLDHFPLVVTNLQTIGEDSEYTSNFVGYTNHQRPVLILMNDFVIQFFECSDDVKFHEFYGLNKESDYQTFINKSETGFSFRIFSNRKRKEFLEEFISSEKASLLIQQAKEYFQFFWQKLFGSYPPKTVLDEYLGTLLDGSNVKILKYTLDEVRQSMVRFVQSKIR